MSISKLEFLRPASRNPSWLATRMRITCLSPVLFLIAILRGNVDPRETSCGYRSSKVKGDGRGEMSGSGSRQVFNDSCRRLQVTITSPMFYTLPMIFTKKIQL